VTTAVVVIVIIIIVAVVAVDAAAAIARVYGQRGQGRTHNGGAQRIQIVFEGVVAAVRAGVKEFR